MSCLVTFEFLKKFNEEEKQKEKDNFYWRKQILLCTLLYNIAWMDLLTENDISNMDELIEIKRNDKNTRKDTIDLAYTTFIASFGLSYHLLNNEEKIEFSKMELNYENCKKFALKIYDKYIDDSKKNTPKEFHFCFKDRAFLLFCHMNKIAININNIVEYIKKYYFFDQGIWAFEEYRDNKVFNEVKNELISIYPKIKEKYGSNRYLDKFLRFFDEENDYNNPLIKDLLDKYYKEKNNNDKEDKENTPLLKSFK